MRNKKISALDYSGSSVNLINEKLAEKKGKKQRQRNNRKKTLRTNKREKGSIEEIRERIPTKTDTGT
jgi:hypothetical protein